jgi:hypothetical protein
MLITAILARNPMMLIPLSVRIILDTRHSVRIKGKEAFLASARFRWSLNTKVREQRDEHERDTGKRPRN